MILRKCNCCGLEAKDIESLQSFKKSKKSLHGRENICNKCFQQKRKPQRDAKLKHRYGITEDDYNALLLKQSYCCALCGIHEKDVPYKLHVDHSHTTKRVRGLLCKRCNTFLGLIGDDQEAGMKVYRYMLE